MADETRRRGRTEGSAASSCGLTDWRSWPAGRPSPNASSSPIYSADGVIARVRALAAAHGAFGASFDDPEDKPARMLAAMVRAVDPGAVMPPVRRGWQPARSLHSLGKSLCRGSGFNPDLTAFEPRNNSMGAFSHPGRH